MTQSLTERYTGPPCGSAVVLRPNCDYGHAAGDVLCGRDGKLSVFAWHPHFDYARFVHPRAMNRLARAQVTNNQLAFFAMPR